MSSSDNNKQPYLSPIFTDTHRLAKIQATLPTLDKLYKQYAEIHHFPGYAFGIMCDGKLIHAGSGGYADLANKTPATIHSLFRIASVTKSFTAMAILKLRDEGKLRLDDPVTLYIPELNGHSLTQDAPLITIRDLLTHSAGFPQDDSWGDRRLDMTEQELIALLKTGVRYSNVPGTTYEYSNLAYALLGYIIHKVSGISYQKYIANHICQPLEMNQTAWEFADIPADQLARGYRRLKDSFHEEELLHDGVFGAMGGLITSIQSLSYYVGLHQLVWPARDGLETCPVKRCTLREMQQPMQFHELNPRFKFLSGRECIMTSAYGYGLRWLRNCEGKVFVGHSGGLPGFGSNWFIMPDYGIGALLFVNATYAPARDINLQILDTLITEAQLTPRQLPPSQILQETKARLLQLLPEWNNAERSGLFAENFFLDFNIESLKVKSNKLFAKAGKITQVSDIIPENQLRGHFIVTGEKAQLKIHFTLTPQNPALIQHYTIEEVSR